MRERRRRLAATFHDVLISRETRLTMSATLALAARYTQLLRPVRSCMWRQLNYRPTNRSTPISRPSCQRYHPRISPVGGGIVSLTGRQRRRHSSAAASGFPHQVAAFVTPKYKRKPSVSRYRQYRRASAVHGNASIELLEIGHELCSPIHCDVSVQRGSGS